ncbi:MAG: MATE family efflux transporter [Ruminococcus sp.]|nr:MATE family efflux transporter [Ruminococcus sp.]
MKQERFFYSVCRLAIPVALQCLLQASFSVLDQVMIGQMGSVDVAAVGLAAKFTSIFTVMVSAVSTVAGIMISQYLGQKNNGEVRKSLAMNMIGAVGLAVLFTVLCTMIPTQIMGLYTPDKETITASAGYMTIVSATFLPVAGATLLSTVLRCMEKASLPMYASFVAAIINTALNYLLIFGKFGFPVMGVTGAAIATVIAQAVNFLLIFLMYRKYRNSLKVSKDADKSKVRLNWPQYVSMLIPILICEFMWSLGENVYAAIYGHLGTDSTAAMTLLNPIQGLVIGALSGLSQAAGVIVGKLLGSGDRERAYIASKKLILYGFIGSLFFSVIVVLVKPWYVLLYQVEEPVKLLAGQIMVAYAMVAPFKVQNMIVGGGVIRSGGKTSYVMAIDLIGTWVFGVPLGLMAAFVFHLSIPYVYFILSLEECIRFGISVVVLRRKKWMQSLEATNTP